MLGSTFYHSTIRKYVMTFGVLFNDIEIPRYDADGKLDQMLKVPLSYAKKEKVLARITADPGADRQAAVVLPRMSFELLSLEYDGDRHLNPVNKLVHRTSNTYATVFNPVPYNFNFQLHTYVKAAEDGTKIVEQYLPFFVPEFVAAAHLIPEAGTTNLPFIHTRTTLDDQGYEGNFLDRRVLVWTSEFTLKAFLWGPERDVPVIKFVNVSFYDSSSFDDIRDAVGNSSPIDRVTVRPGLAANGQPVSNVQSSVPLNQIEANDDFGYIVTDYGNLDPEEGTGGSNEPIT